MNFLKTLGDILLVLTTICYCYQILYLILPLIKKRTALPAGKPNRYAILIAARNEEAVLPHLLDSIAAQDYPQELITTFVIADNCTDRTAQAALAHGAKVYTRFNQKQVGKGYALNYLLEQIRLSGELENYDAFLIFDADNLLAPDFVSQINKVCSAGYEAFSSYRNTKNFGSNWLSGAYGLMYLHESAHQNQSRMELGTCCAVTGTGFGFTRRLLEKMGGWNYFTLTEDIEFRTWCATSGIRIGYCHDAILYDEQPTSFRVSVRQRTRWVQGGVQVSVRYAANYIKGLFRGGRTAWSSFEAATLSLWGYGASAFSCCLRFLAVFLVAGWTGLLPALALAFVTAYGSMLLIGGLTLAMEWHRIRATPAEKLQALFGFPIFVLSYGPIAVTALFRKRRWQPIPHTAVVSAAQLR